MDQVDYTNLLTFATTTTLLFLLIAFRYVLISGIFFVAFYVLDPKGFESRKIFPKHRDRRQYKMEVKWSIITSAIFAISGTFMFVLWQEGYTKVYEDLNEYGWWYIPVSFIVATLIHETYYYWLHRWMHKPKIYRLIHKRHHESHITSPWTSFSFHPVEGILQSVVVPVIILFVPMHYFTIMALLVFMTISSAINHCNVEIYPKGFYKHWLGKWLIGATHHSLHHTQYRFNFGLYFTFWDKWMKTESEKYKTDFVKNTSTPTVTNSPD